MSEKMIADVEPHLRTEEEIRELQPRVDFMAERMCQTQGMVLWALKEAGLTVVLLDPRAREIAPDDVSECVYCMHGCNHRADYCAMCAACAHFLAEQRRRENVPIPLPLAELAAAEERGRRRMGAEWLAALWTWKRYRPECLSNLGDIQRASDNPAPCPGCIPLRALVRAALAPRDSGKETVLVLHPAQDGTCMYCHVEHVGICDAMNGQEDRK